MSLWKDRFDDKIAYAVCEYCMRVGHTRLFHHTTATGWGFQEIVYRFTKVGWVIGVGEHAELWKRPDSIRPPAIYGDIQPPGEPAQVTVFCPGCSGHTQAAPPPLLVTRTPWEVFLDRIDYSQVAAPPARLYPTLDEVYAEEAALRRRIEEAGLSLARLL